MSQESKPTIEIVKSNLHGFDNSDVEQEIEQDIPQDEVKPEGAEQEQEEFTPNSFLEKELEKINGVNDEEEEKEEPKETEQKELDAYTWAEKTGRKPEEFFEFNKDWDNEPPENVIKKYYKEQNPSLTQEEIDYKYSKKYGEDSFDDEIEISINLKEEMKSALKYLKGINDSAGLEVKKDVSVDVPAEYKDAIELSNAVKMQQEIVQNNQLNYLKTLTDYYKDFDGVEVEFSAEIGEMKKDVSLKYNPSKSELKNIVEIQRDTGKLFQKYGNFKEDGSLEITDPKGLFSAIAVASNPESMAKFYFEQGVAQATESFIETELKRPNFDGRQKRTLPSGNTIEIKKGVI